MEDTTHRWIVDAVDEDVATCEVDGVIVLRVPRCLLPEGVGPGSRLLVSQARDGMRATVTFEADGRAEPLPLPDAGASGSGDITL